MFDRTRRELRIAVMDRSERDVMILSLLEPADRAKIEEVVDELLGEELPSTEPPFILAAAEAFDARAESLPDDEKIVAWQIAAALRGRAGELAARH
jgi:hypothetical protein